jgi:hypothetical protein
MNVKKSEIEQSDLISNVLNRSNYRDCYHIAFQTKSEISLNDCLKPIFEKPAWMELLYKIRDVLVKPFGLYTVSDETINLDATIGENLAFFRIQNRTNREIMVYGDDKHLEAWFSVILDKQDIYACIKFTTVVHYHNLFGRVYFTLIRPFHYLILRSTLKKLHKIHSK